MKKIDRLPVGNAKILREFIKRIIFAQRKGYVLPAIKAKDLRTIIREGRFTEWIRENAKTR